MIYLKYQVDYGHMPKTGTLQLQTNASNPKDNLFKLLKPLFLVTTKKGYEADLSAPFIIGTYDPKAKVLTGFIADRSARYGDKDTIYNAINTQALKALKNLDIGPHLNVRVSFLKDTAPSDGVDYFDVLADVAKKQNATARLKGSKPCQVSDDAVIFDTYRGFILTPESNLNYINLEHVL